MNLTPIEREKAHPTPITYVKIASILVLLTALEVAIFYVESLESILIPLFLVLSAVKFVLVAMFYMHLKFDSRIFSGFFITGLLLATAVIVALMALFDVFARTPTLDQPTVESVESKEPATSETILSSDLKSDSVPKTGPAIFEDKACGACHAVEGLSTGSIGPSLDGIAIRAADRKPGLGSEAYLRESIENPSVFLVEDYLPLMPPTIRDSLTDEQFESLIKFLMTLK